MNNPLDNAQHNKPKRPFFWMSFVGYGIHLLLYIILGAYSDHCANIVQTAMDNPNFDASNEYESWESVTYFLAYFEMILYSYFPLILFGLMMLCLSILKRKLLHYSEYFIKFTGIWLGIVSLVVFLLMYINLVDMQQAYRV